MCCPQGLLFSVLRRWVTPDSTQVNIYHSQGSILGQPCTRKALNSFVWSKETFINTKIAVFNKEKEREKRERQETEKT